MPAADKQRQTALEGKAEPADYGRGEDPHNHLSGCVLQQQAHGLPIAFEDECTCGPQVEPTPPEDA